MKYVIRSLLVSLLVSQNFVMTSFALDVQSMSTENLSVAQSEPSKSSVKMTAQEKADLLKIERNAKKTLFPFTSHLTPGVVEKHTLAQKSSIQQPPIFVIGDDYSSVVWLKKNKVMLESIHAVGMITNVESQRRVDEISEDAHWKPLLPVSMNGAEDSFNVEHVPFYVYQGVVSQ